MDNNEYKNSETAALNECKAQLIQVTEEYSALVNWLRSTASYILDVRGEFPDESEISSIEDCKAKILNFVIHAGY